MKPIAVKNSYGETIEVKWDADGNIQVRHSDVDKRRFGQFCELAKRLRQPSLREHLNKYLAAQGTTIDDPLVQQLLGQLGSLLVIDGRSFAISAEETALILQTVKQNGGILPNWSNRP